jgi:dihydroorotase
MDILLRQVRIIDPSSPFHQQQADLFIQNGRIAESTATAPSNATLVEIPGLCVSPGWMDTFAHFCDPGLEDRETLESGAASAAAGGYTDVMVLPNTSPVLHNKASIEYIQAKQRHLPVTLHPIGAVTRNTEGKELTEMYDMERSGAIAFSDGTATIQSAGLLLKALQYLKAVNRQLIQLPDDRSLSGQGLMNEGVLSTRLGLPGRPAIAEELMIRRDLELARYAGARIHFTAVSTAKGLDEIRRAREEGIHVTCSVTPYHLLLTEEALAQYDSNLKVNPPLRTEGDRAALVAGLHDGTIDCLATHHLPFNSDQKDVEFEYAGFGMIGLETAFSILRMAAPDLPLQRVVELLSIHPRKLFGLSPLSIKAGEAACLSLFQPDARWTPTAFKSRSVNSPFLGKELKGRPVGIINKDSLFLNA